MKPGYTATFVFPGMSRVANTPLPMVDVMAILSMDFSCSNSCVVGTMAALIPIPIEFTYIFFLFQR